MYAHITYCVCVIGDVCLRVPVTLSARVELCGASVDMSPEVVFHEAENHQAQGQTTVMGKLYNINTPDSLEPLQLIQHR